MKESNILCFAFCALFSEARAAEFVTMADPINFGDLVQVNKDSSVIMMSYNGIRTMTGAAATKSLNIDSGEIVFVNESDENKSITFSPVSDVNVSGCSATLSNFVFSHNALTIGAGNKSYVNIGATLNINGFCPAGTYNGNAVINYTIDNASDMGYEAVNLPFTFSLDVPLSISAETDLDFGSYVSPATDGIIVVDEEGTDTGGLMLSAGSKPHVGVILANGVSGRGATVELSEKNLQLMSDKDSISAELNISPSTFVFGGNELLDSSQIIVVGGKVYIKANQPAGEYVNTVYVTIFYND